MIPRAMFLGKALATFADMEKWLALFPQNDGPKKPIDENGNEYIEISCCFPCRNTPFDKLVAERQAVAYAWQSLFDIGCRSPATAILSWRTRPELEVAAVPQVVEYRDDGPDVDYVSDRRCVYDRNWMMVKVYCRLSVMPIERSRLSLTEAIEKT